MQMSDVVLVALSMTAIWLAMPVPASRPLNPSPEGTPRLGVERPPRIGPAFRRGLVPAVGTLAALVLGSSVFSALVVGGLLVVSAQLQTRREASRTASELREALPEVVDLIGLGIGSGGTVVLGLRLVVRMGPPAVRRAFERAVTLIEGGETRRVALQSLVEQLGPDYRPFVDVLTSGERNGAPISEILDRLGSEAIASHKRLSDERARRTPVKLLAPLVVCSLPAVLVGTVVPLVYLAFGNVELPGR